MSTEAADFAIGWVDCGEVGDHSTRAAGPQEPAGRRAASDQIEFKVQQKQRLPIPKLGFLGATNTDFYLVGATVCVDADGDGAAAGADRVAAGAGAHADEHARAQGDNGAQTD